MAATGERLADPQAEAAVAAVQQRLQEAASAAEPGQRAAQPVEIVLVDSPVVNAQAFPGGLIVIHRGLLERMRCPEELAAVVAHEMAHVRYRDSLSALRRQLGLSVLLSVVGMPQGAEALQRMIEQASTLHYSRRIEARADRYALELLAAGRLDPARLGDALQHIAEAGQPELPGRLPDVLEYLQTHPSVQDRIEAARARSRELGVPEQPIAVPGGWPVTPAGPTPADLPDT